MEKFVQYKLLCPRGTQTCALQTDTQRCPQPTSRLTEMEKWSWIRIQNPISTKIEHVLEVHPLLPPTKFGGDPWTRSWYILRTKECAQTHRHTDTRRWPQDLAAYGAQVINSKIWNLWRLGNVSVLNVIYRSATWVSLGAFWSILSILLLGSKVNLLLMF